MKLDLYYCMIHGYVDQPDEFMGKQCCPHFDSPEDHCLFELEGPFPAEVDLTPQQKEQRSE